MLAAHVTIWFSSFTFCLDGKKRKVERVMLGDGAKGGMKVPLDKVFCVATLTFL